MTKSEFIDWKGHPVTKEVFRILSGRIQDMYEMLGSSAGLDPGQDREFVGAIKAYKDMITIEYTEETE